MIDTLETFRRLVDSDLTEKQAEAVVSAINSTSDKVATRDDLARLEERFDAQLALLEARLTRTLVGTQIAVVALAVAIIKLF